MSDPKKILITGSSSGFGRLTAEALLSRGHCVFATMRDPDGKNQEAASRLKSFAESVAGVVHVLRLDVTSDREVSEAVQDAVSREGFLDVVVNNAGIGTGSFVESYTVDQLKRLFEVNVFGVQRVNRAVLPHMRERRSGSFGSYLEYLWAGCVSVFWSLHCLQVCP